MYKDCTPGYSWSKSAHQSSGIYPLCAGDRQPLSTNAQFHAQTLSRPHFSNLLSSPPMSLKGPAMEYLFLFQRQWPLLSFVRYCLAQRISRISRPAAGIFHSAPGPVSGHRGFCRLRGSDPAAPDIFFYYTVPK